MRRVIWTWALVATVVLGGAWPDIDGSVMAQEREYRSDWRRTPARRDDRERVQAMIAELRQLIERAERMRAADPLFLRDLGDLAQRYEWPWHVRVLYDDFYDGDITANPTWTPSGGTIFVDRFVGVRTSVPLRRRADARGARGGGQRPEDLAIQLFGALLQQSQSQGDRGEDRSTFGRRHRHEAGLVTQVALSNAFAIRLRLSSVSEPGGRIEFGVSQGAGMLGYRLAYNAKADPSLELIRMGRHGGAVIDASRKRFTLEDQAFHEIEFTRGAKGAMTVSVDGEELIRTTDRGFRDPFDGVLFVNHGGEFTLRSIAIYGTQ